MCYLLWRKSLQSNSRQSCFLSLNTAAVSLSCFRMLRVIFLGWTTIEGQIVIERDGFVRDEKCTLNSKTLNRFVTIKGPTCWLMKAQHLAMRWKVKWRSIFFGKVEDSLSTQTIFHLNVSPFSPIGDEINNTVIGVNNSRLLFFQSSSLKLLLFKKVLTLIYLFIYFLRIMFFWSVTPQSTTMDSLLWHIKTRHKNSLLYLRDVVKRNIERCKWSTFVTWFIHSFSSYRVKA